MCEQDKNDFTYKAPQYVDFSSFNEEDSEDLEEYFDTNHEQQHILPGMFENISLDKKKKEVEWEFFSETAKEEPDQGKDIQEMIENISIVKKEKEGKRDFYPEFDKEDDPHPTEVTLIESNGEGFLRNGMKKSLSTGDILSAWRESNLNKQQTEIMNTTHCEQKTCKRNNVKSNFSHFQHQKHPNNTRAKFASKEWINKLAQPKYVSNEHLHTSVYVSFAEAVQKFQKGTPTRFHTKSHKDHDISKSHDNVYQKHITIAKSPTLKTKSRIRSTQVLPQEEREIKEFENAQRNKIAAHPINWKILQKPAPMARVEKRPVTVPEPFHLSENMKKEHSENHEVEKYQFRANPIPEGVLNPVHNPVIKKSVVTRPQTPKLMKRLKEKMAEEQVNKNNVVNQNVTKPVKLTRTEVKPFSFEDRDKDLLKKKQELINKVMEEEKKMREFHAKPPPKFISQKQKSSQNCSKISNSSYKSTESLDHPAPVFRARPAKVLHMKPFEPKKAEKPLVEIVDFELNTDKRAKKREEFEQKLKEKDIIIAEYQKKLEEERMRQEEEEIIRLRKEAEYKAQPIRQYKKIEPLPSKNLTVPVSPKFSTLKRSHHNKENITE